MSESFDFGHVKYLEVEYACAISSPGTTVYTQAFMTHKGACISSVKRGSPPFSTPPPCYLVAVPARLAPSRLSLSLLARVQAGGLDSCKGSRRGHDTYSFGEDGNSGIDYRGVL